jgi:undecaprenyl-diphosphatase
MTAGKKRTLKSGIARWRLNEFWVLLFIFMKALGAWIFIEIADEVIEGEALPLDRWVFSLFHQTGKTHPEGPDWLVTAMLDVSALGGWTVMTLITGIVSGYLFLSRRRRLLLVLLIAVLGGALLSLGLKELFARERPPVSLFLTPGTFGFPSGHSMMSAVLYPTLAVLLARVQERLKVRVYLLLMGVLLPLLVGFSRIYLGFHYLTDVLAGWAGGMAWASLAGFIARHLQQKGKIRENGRASIS